MNTHLLALQLMAIQGLLGAFDTLYHHEFSESLAQRKTARLELAIHSLRALIYSGLFIGLSAWEWHGGWAALLLGIFALEILLTLWDFVIEDRTRLLPATERVTHTILAINSGAFILLLMLTAPAWLAQPTGLSWHYQGWLTVILALCGLGAGISGIRDGLAACQLSKREARDRQQPEIHFSQSRNRVLVTGGTGFIGQLLVRELLMDGQDVTVLTRQPRAAAWLFDGRVRCIGRIEDLAVNEPIDVIINLAGERILGKPWTAARKQALLQSRVKLTKTLVGWISRAEHKPSLMLSASAVGYYGVQEQGDNRQLTEQSPPQSIFMSQLCREWEQAATEAADYGVAVVRLRLGVVLGHQGPLPMMLLPIKLALGGPLGGGRQWFSWIHVQDVLRAIAHLWQLQAANALPLRDSVYNLTAPNVVSQAQFAKTAARLLHRPCIIPTPGWPMRLALGEQADLLLEGQYVVPQKLLETGFQFQYPTLAAALADLTS